MRNSLYCLRKSDEGADTVLMFYFCLPKVYNSCIIKYTPTDEYDEYFFICPLVVFSG